MPLARDLGDAPLPPVAARALALIRSEHRAITCMGNALRALVSRYLGAGRALDFALCEAMLAYLENVPDHVHHPKEDAVLFPALARHTAEGEKLIAELEGEHARSVGMLAALRDALCASRDGGGDVRDRLTLGVDEFVVFSEAHIRREEQQLLPLAVSHLTEAEWQLVEHTFSDDVDPPFSLQLADDYRRLYQCIAEMMPAALRPHLVSDLAPPAGT